MAIDEEYQAGMRLMREVFGPAGPGFSRVWRGSFGLLVYAHQSLMSLPPLFVLFWVANEAWWQIALKVLAGVWLALVMLSQLVMSVDSDQHLGRTYRKNRAMYSIVILCCALMLWNPSRIVFFVALGGFVFVSVGYIVVMQAVWARNQSRGTAGTAPASSKSGSSGT
jgi:hypothetical protein